jgi:hypothetical protein
MEVPIPKAVHASFSVRRIARNNLGPSQINKTTNRITIPRITTGWKAASAVSPIVNMSSIVLRRKFGSERESVKLLDLRAF